jgi:hypothetical protein
MEKTRVAGEDLDVLCEALTHVHFHEDDDGIVECDFELEPRIGHPFRRALMRVEAELLLHDAERIGVAAEDDRTDDQRRADALVALIFRIIDAIPDAA